MNGKGTYYYAYGNIYEGQWVEGNKHGEGSHTWVDGQVRDRLTLPPHPTRNPRPKPLTRTRTRTPTLSRARARCTRASG